MEGLITVAAAPLGTAKSIRLNTPWLVQEKLIPPNMTLSDPGATLVFPLLTIGALLTEPVALTEVVSTRSKEVTPLVPRSRSTLLIPAFSMVKLLAKAKVVTTGLTSFSEKTITDRKAESLRSLES